jgi:NAD(P)-dependent dehydrogenase (short-subunit alcohol dehydrogenase family)
MSEGKLAGRAAIVTGGAQGIGGGCARRLAADGAQVLIVDTDADLAQATSQQINDSGGSSAVLVGDISKEETARAMVEDAMFRFGRLDILVQNAFGVGGSTFGGGALDVELEGWQGGIDVLVTALYLGARHAVPAMEASGVPDGFDTAPYGQIGMHTGEPPKTEVGRIVNMSSVHGLLQAAGMLVYEAGKMAVIGMTKQMAIDFGPKGITVNAIAPGHIITEKLDALWREIGNEQGHRLFELQYPVRRLGRPEDVAAAVAFLSSSDASFITGVVLPVDGGMSIQLQENIVMEVKQYIQENPDIRTVFDGFDAQKSRL